MKEKDGAPISGRETKAVGIQKITMDIVSIMDIKPNAI